MGEFEGRVGVDSGGSRRYIDLNVIVIVRVLGCRSGGDNVVRRGVIK